MYCMQKNTCTVKYIHLESIDPMRFHVSVDYEMSTVQVRHSTYDELHQAVFDACPKGFVCTEPLALYHEVLWSTGVKIKQSTGESELLHLERDELHHAIEGEYAILWGRDDKSHAVLSICVDVVKDNALPDNSTLIS